jgi:hypothetical protein
MCRLSSAWHEAAGDVFKGSAQFGGASWAALARSPAFLQLATRPGLFQIQKPLSVAVAFDLIDAWLQQPSVTLPEPTARHLQTMRDLIAPWFLPATSKRFSFVQ